jgi:hypothetical protein
MASIYSISSEKSHRGEDLSLTGITYQFETTTNLFFIKIPVPHYSS